MIKRQEKIYIIGHKNPDTDSICSAIAYADIKNRTTQSKHYFPRRAGEINEETEFVLKYFDIQPPGYMENIGTQVSDMDIHVTPEADRNMTLRTAWEQMVSNDIWTLPICSKSGQLEGIVTIGDITKTYMQTMDNHFLSNAKTQFIKIAETLNGKVLEGNARRNFTNGKVLVAAASPDIFRGYVEKDDLVIAGNRVEDHLEAIEKEVSCLVVGMNMPVSEEVLSKAREKGTIIISSPYDTFTIARLINQSAPIGCIMYTGKLLTFSTSDYTDDIQEVMIKNRHQAFPVLDKKGKCLGTISRRNFLDMHKKKVILVDHNEKDQAVDNIEKAEILEIIDHHKLGSLETMTPISFRNQPVGCTGTILYQIYGEQKLEISPKIAGLLLAAIISDTLMFRSPTCTLQDKMAAGALALIADIDIEKFAKEMFRAGSNLRDKTPEEIFYQDFKKFTAEEDITFGVGQISSMDAEELTYIRSQLMPYMAEVCAHTRVDKIYFMLTNIMESSTDLLYYGKGSDEMAEKAFHVRPENGSFHLKGVVSRKKQVIPAMMEAAQAMSNDFS